MKIEQKIGKQIRGNATKIHIAVDLKGIPAKFILLEENKHDITFAKDLISNLKINTVRLLTS